MNSNGREDIILQEEGDSNGTKEDKKELKVIPIHPWTSDKEMKCNQVIREEAKKKDEEYTEGRGGLHGDQNVLFFFSPFPCSFLLRRDKKGRRTCGGEEGR